MIFSAVIVPKIWIEHIEISVKYTEGHLLTDSIQHDAVPALFSQRELSVELKLNSVVSPHLMREEQDIINYYESQPE